MLLFLDFDGVLHPLGSSPDRLFCRLPALESWLRAHEAVEVVISSTWRVSRSLDELKSFFAEDLRSRVQGVTPVLRHLDWSEYHEELPPMRFEREDEIRRYRNSSGQSWRPWSALDDQAWLFRPFCAELVLCDHATGLSEANLCEVSRHVRAAC
ncbi:MAG: hypothetical protein E6Q40_03190 [Cupriavidus sp.]|nr:MAG: hypothetical protein E6Q40_03190 [Cupriavidus sp.]